MANAPQGREKAGLILGIQILSSFILEIIVIILS